MASFNSNSMFRQYFHLLEVIIVIIFVEKMMAVSFPEVMLKKGI